MRPDPADLRYAEADGRILSGRRRDSAGAAVYLYRAGDVSGGALLCSRPERKFFGEPQPAAPVSAPSGGSQGQESSHFGLQSLSGKS